MTSARGRLGQWGENQARLHLEARGSALLATNYRCRWGEVDIVARQGQELVFVEVKTRRGSDFGAPEESITPAKARHLTGHLPRLPLQTQIPPADVANASWRIDLVSLHLD
jgi:putative endonuclease